MILFEFTIYLTKGKLTKSKKRFKQRSKPIPVRTVPCSLDHIPRGTGCLYLDKALLPGHLVGRGGAKGPFEVNLSLMRPPVPSFSLLKVPGKKRTETKTKQDKTKVGQKHAKVSIAQ